MPNRPRLLLLMMLAVSLAGCNRSPPNEDAGLGSEVRGSVSYRERIALTTEAELEVRLIRLTTTGGPAPVVGLVRMRNPGQIPIGFAVPLDPKLIEAAIDYGVVASIRDRGQTLFLSPRPQPVSGEEKASPLALVLERVAAEETAGIPAYDCRGEEPSWHVSIDGGVLRFHRLVEDPVHWEFSGRYRIQGAADHNSVVWHGVDRAWPSHRLTAWITEQSCTADRPYAVSITLPDVNVVRGCCQRTRPLRVSGATEPILAGLGDSPLRPD